MSHQTLNPYNHTWVFPGAVLPAVGKACIPLSPLPGTPMAQVSHRVQQATLPVFCDSHNENGCNAKAIHRAQGNPHRCTSDIPGLYNSVFSISLILLEDGASGMLKFPVTQNLHRLSHFKPRAVHPTENSKH